MLPCRLEASKSSPCSSPAACSMDEYFAPLGSSAADGANDDYNGQAEGGETDDVDGVYAQLALKERDLNLAAELGKALLEQNHELQAKNQSLIEQYSIQIEDLNQEKHEVKLRLERVQDEYELTLRDLQQELAQVRDDLDAQGDASKKTEAVKSEVMKELTQQNQRLTQQLRKANNMEESLQKQVESLKRQLSNRRTSLQDHVHQLQVLTEEIQMLTERRAELEKRVQHLSTERDSLAASLEEAQDKILHMERQKFEQEKLIRTLEQQKAELEEQNSHLLQRLDSLSIHSHSATDSNQGMSLLDEFSSIDHTISLDSLEAVSPDIQRESEDDIECDDDLDSLVIPPGCMSADSLDVSHPFASVGIDGEEDLTSELLQMHDKLQFLHRQLSNEDGHNSPIPLTGSQLKDLNAVLQQTMHSVSNKIKESMPHWSADAENKDESSSCVKQLQVEKRISSLQTELSNSRRQLQEIRTEMSTRDQQLRHKDIALNELKEKLRCREGELRHLREELDKLQDEAAGLTKDAIVDQARWERDQALKKRNKLELDMGNVRVELMSLESQLIEAVQQKLDLSQQLDLWQGDMQELIGSQIIRIQY
ncbi:hypothetical protein CAPTEDRAFT_190234 [Capitella teleta]|uniref:HAP1 N-terminal domain-containing protein n=1 Tax=Capitella teleta TaxID=283909 RepID=R7V5B9_CAPTE|nr:hypothetical protein CAPTEDRAFT_190234 [Capitella teleta]|eukprot:ELU13657.1 hypothetical protein CAPTEDRAFT_190234 [Capitella teleta]